jgi:hypothetical protein
MIEGRKGKVALRLIGGWLLVCVLCWPLASCRVYSFTGANLSSDIKTLSVRTFIDRSGGGPPNLAQVFSERTRDFLQRNSRLALTQQPGDLQFEGAIVGYTLSPIASQGNEQAALTRLTITVQVKFVNIRDETANFDQAFSQYEDFSASTPLTTVEQQYIQTISDKIILDVFNRSVANW